MCVCVCVCFKEKCSNDITQGPMEKGIVYMRAHMWVCCWGGGGGHTGMQMLPYLYTTGGVTGVGGKLPGTAES